jgi:hypothetical protein
MSEHKKLHLPLAYRSVVPSTEVLEFTRKIQHKKVEPKTDLRFNLLTLAEMMSLKNLGEATITAIVSRVNENKPETFGQSIPVPTTTVRPFNNAQGTRFLAVYFEDERLEDERDTMLSNIRSVVGKLPPRFEQFQFSVIFGEFEQGYSQGGSNLDVKKEFDDMRPDGFMLAPGVLD